MSYMCEKFSKPKQKMLNKDIMSYQMKKKKKLEKKKSIYY